MRLVTRFSSFVSDRAESRFSSEDARFRLAVTSGFVIAAVGFLSIVVADRTGSAQGFFESLFGGAMYNQPSRYEAQTRPIPAPYRHAARRSGERVKAVRFAKQSDDEDETTATGGGHSVCVRLCDGFAFPVGDYHGERDRAAHEATCHSQCPSAQTALFLLPAGSETITDAVNARTGRAYSALPDAFHYTTVLDEACTCHPVAGNRVKSLLRDFTLRRGDAVMTSRGFQVFHGAAQYPFRRKDFVALNRSPDIRKDARATYKAIERASLQTSSTLVAEQPAPPTSASVSSRTGTKTLEHQASR